MVAMSLHPPTLRKSVYLCVDMYILRGDLPLEDFYVVSDENLCDT